MEKAHFILIVISRLNSILPEWISVSDDLHIPLFEKVHPSNFGMDWT